MTEDSSDADVGLDDVDMIEQSGAGIGLMDDMSIERTFLVDATQAVFQHGVSLIVLV
jgi:hypothetical protein